MKHYIYILTAALALGFASCAEDYLETVPNDAVSTETAFATTENCALAVNGLAKIMTKQYLSTQGMNGEGTMKNWYNNFNGNDMQKCNQTGWSSLWNNIASYKKNKASSYCYYPWFYYYKIIGNANQIIDRVDASSGAEADKAYVKAQALVFRAYSYYNLATMYAQRWCGSNNGASDGVVLRLKATDAGEPQDMPLSTLAETFQQIYKDLDEAIAGFQQSGKSPSKDEFYLPSLQAAYAIKARAALYREDWQTAADCAKKAREGHPLMSASEYHEGFNAPNDEWIWGVYEAEDQTLYYYSYYAYIGSDSSAGAVKNYPCAMSKQLADQLSPTDKRIDLYLIPQSDTEFKEMNKTTGQTTKGTMFSRGKNSGWVNSASKIFGYMQFKLRCAFMPGGGSFNLCRSAEMYYCEAEADCHLGKEAEAAQLLYDITSKFDPQYKKSSNSGQALLDEVRLYRRFDLWGEGYNWQDYKRWNLDIDRKKLNVAEGLASPGSWHSTFAQTIAASDLERWTWVIPNKECDYNNELKEND